MKETDPSPDPTGDRESIWDITHILKTLSADMLELLMVEARLFGRTALVLVGLAVVIALLLVSGWLFTAAALTWTLANLEFFSLAGALLTVALAHLLLAILALWRLRVLIRDLAFRESLASVNTLFTLARSLAGAAGRSPEEK